MSGPSTRARQTLPLLLLAAACAGGPGPTSCSSSEALGPRGAPVRRGLLEIDVVQRGSLEARDAVTVQSAIEGQATILFLAEEGTLVEPGELLVELDASTLVDRRVTQEISVQNADASWVKSQQAYAIQQSQNESEIDTSERNVQFAELDLQKYLEGDWPQTLRESEEEIILAEEEKARSEERLNWSRDLAEKGFLTRTELEGDQLAAKRSEIMLERARRMKELLIEFDHPRKLEELRANQQEMRRELERTRMRADARLVDFRAELGTNERKLELEREKLARLVAQIEKARVVATIAGMVVHTREDSGRFGNSEPLQVGSQVRERQLILSIPTAEGMTAEASVHESVLKQIVPGLSCTIRVDALPGDRFDGTVRFVAPLPDKASWWANPDQRLFKTEVAIANPVPGMRPGMSCSIEFHVDRVADVLLIPLQSVIVHEGRTIVFVDGPSGAELRGVEVGRSNDRVVEISMGLSEGEIVLLAPPEGFTPRPAEHGAGPEGSEEGAPIDGGAERAPREQAGYPGGPARSEGASGASSGGRPGERPGGRPTADGRRGERGERPGGSGGPGGEGRQRPPRGGEGAPAQASGGQSASGTGTGEGGGS